MREAESHAEDDKKRREEIEIKNRADQSLYTAERMLKDTGDKIAIVDKNAIENAMADLKKAIDGNDTAAMSRAMDALMQAQHKAAEALYKQQQTATGPQGSEGSEGSGGSEGSAGSAGSGGGPGAENKKTEGDVIDAEVVEDDKK